MNFRASIALTFFVFLLSCRPEDSATGSDAVATRPVAARIAGGGVSPEIWNSTDSVRFKAVTTANDVLLDTGFSLVGKTGVLRLKSVSVRSDLGVTLTARGYQTGFLLWEGTATGAASSGSQILEMRISLADTVANSAPPLGTVNAPVIDSLRTLTGGASGVSNDEPVRVFLSTLTDSASIVYTLDGSSPTNSSQVYRASGLVIDSSCSLRAMAVRRRYTNSALLAQSFVLQAESATVASLSATPWATPDTFDQPVTVKLASQTPDAEIRYTLDGSMPTRSSELYGSAGVLVDSSWTLNAVVYAGKAARSAKVLTKSFVLQARPTSVLSLSATPWATPDTFDQPVTVKLASQTPDAEIRYTLDGSMPTRSSELYVSAGVQVDSSRTLKAVVYAGKAARSANVLVQSFVLQAQPIRFSAQSWFDRFGVVLSCATPGVEIRWTMDGLTPGRNSALYTDSLRFGDIDSVTIRAVGIPVDPRINSFEVGEVRIGVLPPTFVDSRDGQVYRITQIGGEVWMAQNLNYKPWVGGWCYDNDPTQCLLNGRLYTWSGLMAGGAASSTSPSGVRGLCPQGWHIPSLAEWTTMVDRVERDPRVGAGNGGRALKSKLGWNSTGMGGWDYFGFAASPAGSRDSGGVYRNAGYSGSWWSTTGAVYLDMYSGLSGVGRDYDRQSSGFSARCLRD